MIYDLKSDSCLVTWESIKCQELQHPIVSIFSSRFLKTCFLDILFSRAHILRTLFIFRLENGSCLDGA